MSGRKQSRGDCVFCGRNLTKSGLSRHLKSCPARQQAIDSAPKRTRGGKALQLYHLLVQDAGAPDFWLHLEMPGRAQLEDLDYYLRAIWLECCGHLSQFSVGGWRGEEIPMSRRIDAVFKPDLVLTHIYKPLDEPGSREKGIADVARVYGGEILFGEELAAYAL